MVIQSKRTSKSKSQLQSKALATAKNQVVGKGLRRSQKLLVIGMHRAGTSMLSGLVKDLGVHQLGNRPMPSKPDNPDGFFEDIAIQELNDRLLAAIGGTWSSPIVIRDRVLESDPSLVIELVREGRDLVYRCSQDCGTPYFVKDPRISLLAPQWRRVLLGDTPTIIALRNPLDVARSLQLRDNITYRHALALWYAYMDGATRAGIGVPNIIIDYDEAVSRPEQARKAISQFLSKNLCGHNSEEFVPRQDVQFRPNMLTRRNLEFESSNGEATKDALDFYLQLRSRHLRSLRLSDGNTALPRWVTEVLDSARRDRESTDKLRDLESVVASLSNQVEQVEAERVRLEGVLGEERAKSEYLFAEAGVLREQVVVKEAEVAAREAELRQLRRQMSALDHEVTNLAISTLKNQDAAARLDRALIENQTFADCLKWVTLDLKSFTDSRIYRIRRKVRLFAATAFSLKRKGIGLNRDVIPLDIDPEEFVSSIRITGLTEQEMLSRRPDLHRLRINPFVHYVTRGRSENVGTD